MRRTARPVVGSTPPFQAVFSFQALLLAIVLGDRDMCRKQISRGNQL